MPSIPGSRNWGREMAQPRCRRCSRSDTDHVPHGTATGYTYHACRCDLCRDFMATEQRRRLSRDGAYRDRQYECRRKWASKNPEYVSARHADWRKANRDHIRKRGRQLYSEMPDERRVSVAATRNRYRVNNRDQLNDYTRHWRARNPESVAASQRRINQRGGSGSSRAGARWTATEDLIISTRHDLTVAEIAAILGRGYRSITTRRYILRRELESAA